MVDVGIKTVFYDSALFYCKRRFLNDCLVDKVMNICKRIMGEDVPFLNLEAKKGFFAKIGEKI